MLLTIKFIDGLPLTRFGKVLGRHGVPVPVQTLARWVIGCARLMQPLLHLMRDALLEGSVVHIDETVVQVLKSSGKTPTSNSYMWVQTGGPPGKPVVIYDHDPSRSGEVPVRLLHDYHGYLMTDGYDAYNQLARTDGIERLVCSAHVRRHYMEAVKVQPKGKRGRADVAVAMIGKLYGIERDAQGCYLRSASARTSTVERSSTGHATTHMDGEDLACRDTKKRARHGAVVHA